MKHYFVTESSSMEYVKKLMASYGMPESDAALVADHLTRAEARGLASHGLQRLPFYAKKLAGGGYRARAEITILRDNGASVQLDARDGCGIVAGRQAMELCIERAKLHGSACVNLTNTNHSGWLAYYTLMAAERNMVGFTVCVSRANTALYGSSERFLGSNPISVAVPAREGKCVVYDGATSIVAQGKLSVAKLEGAAIPGDWAFDPDGNPTTDANMALAGALRTMGGYKGSGLSVLISLICCGLGGVPFDMEQETMRRVTDDSAGSGIDQLFMALDISAFTDTAEFTRRVDAFVSMAKALRREDGVDEIYLPGEIEFVKEAQFKARGGFEISEELYNSLASLARGRGLDCDMDWQKL